MDANLSEAGHRRVLWHAVIRATSQQKGRKAVTGWQDGGMSAAFRDRFRRAIGDAEPEPSSIELSDGDAGDGGTGDGGTGDGEAGEWLAYELHEWSLESRVML